VTFRVLSPPVRSIEATEVHIDVIARASIKRNALAKWTSAEKGCSDKLV